MIIEVPNRYINELTSRHFREILDFLGIPDVNYEVRIVRRDGRNIVIDKDGRKIYVIFSRSQTDGRNTFINQYIVTVLQTYILDQISSQKEIYAYLMDTSRYASTSFMVDTYRMLKTLGINILNERNLAIGNILPYSTVREWKEARDTRRMFNSANSSSYVLDNEDSYAIYGKSFGANGKEAALICCVIAKIANKEQKRVHLYQVKENNTTQLSSLDRLLLEHYGVIIGREILPVFEPRQYQKQLIFETSRDQATFQYNLLNKYGSKKCIICDNSVEESIIASHIHRVADIDKSELPWVEKCRSSVDPDNGFWLCANHDKMFEYGLFYFVNDDLVISNQLKPIVYSLDRNIDRTISQIQNDILKNQVNELVRKTSDLLVLLDFKLKAVYYSPTMHEYLEYHRKRVNGF